ncbi:glycosyltransferase family 2 protein [Thermaerobacter subterraneus]|uniref:Glycosyltransferase n=1 Tax=Thermaerobacter subterraneus DSM 13965 TaxID=867903 RepID=K6PZT3_9FIRM|nr:putative glycosyltransferase [Thermaerobacter subterraneus DSM 13965]
MVRALSVLIATRNRPDALRYCLSSVARQARPPGWNVEVVVLDDAPEISAREVAESFSESLPIRYVRTDARLGVSGARNRLAEEAKGSVLVVLDDDAAFVDDDALVQVVNALDRDSSIGLIAFYIYDDPGGTLHVPFSRLAIRRDPNIVSQEGYVSYFNGGGYAVRRAVLNAVGLYGADMKYGCEELDLAFRLIETGWTILYNPRIKVRHCVATSSYSREWKAFYGLRNHLWVGRRYLPLPYRVVYLVSWIVYMGSELMVRYRRPDMVWVAIKEGIGAPQPRRILSRRAMKYLRQHYGRLWW